MKTCAYFGEKDGKTDRLFGEMTEQFGIWNEMEGKKARKPRGKDCNFGECLV